MRALIIKQPWIDYILDGKKTWEIRGSNTNVRGEIELIQSGSGLVVGKCKVTDCKKLTIDDYKQNKKYHQIDNVDALPYKNTFAWILEKAERYNNPRKYKHPKGAIIWVKL